MTQIEDKTKGRKRETIPPGMPRIGQNKGPYVKNPETGRFIRVGGPTYLNLKDKYDLSKVEKLARLPKTPKNKDQKLSDDGIRAIKKMPLRVLQTDHLEESLETATRPSVRRKLGKMIANKAEGRGSRTRGWGADEPLRGTERHTLKQKCGDKCFLLPDSEGFPVCAKCRGDECSCELDCRGVTAAKVRARQHGYKGVLETIKEIKEPCEKKAASKRKARGSKK